MVRHLDSQCAVLMVAAVSCLFPVHPGFAHSGASGIVLKRMDAMSDMQDHTKALAAMVKGKAPVNSNKIRLAARAFVDHGEQIPSQFPDTRFSRTGGKTEALPALWSDPAAFQKATNEFNDRAQVLNRLVNDGNDLNGWESAFQSVARSCRGCHKQFKKKD